MGFAILLLFCFVDRLYLAFLPILIALTSSFLVASQTMQKCAGVCLLSVERSKEGTQSTYSNMAAGLYECSCRSPARAVTLAVLTCQQAKRCL